MSSFGSLPLAPLQTSEQFRDKFTWRRDERPALVEPLATIAHSAKAASAAAPRSALFGAESFCIGEEAGASQARVTLVFNLISSKSFAGWSRGLQSDWRKRTRGIVSGKSCLW